MFANNLFWFGVDIKMSLKTAFSMCLKSRLSEEKICSVSQLFILKAVGFLKLELG